MRHLACLIVCLAFALAGFAGDDTQALLEARQVRQQLVFTFQPKGTPPVTYVVDGKGNGVLRDDDTFSSPALVNFAYKDFNPLQIAIEAKETSAPEPSIKGLSDILDALVTTAKGVIPPGGATSGAFPTLALTADTPQGVCDNVKTNIQAAFASISGLETPPVSDTDRNNWVKDANGLDGVLKVKSDIEARRDTLKTNLAAADTQVAFLKSIGQIPPASALLPGAPKVAKDQAAAKEVLANGACNLDNKTLAAIGYMAAKGGDLIADRRKTLQALDQLASMLNPFVDRGNWLTPSDYIFFRTDSSPDLMKTINVTFKTTAVTPALGVAAVPEASTTRKFFLRQYRLFVPEVGVAGVYNDLRYPQYKVNSENNKLIVRQNGFATSHVDAAMTLNLLINAGTKFVYPGVQLGVSKAKDYPGLLGGIVFRFAGLKKFALSAGRMATWYKDLDALHVGDEVKSENDLKADLKQRRARTATYFAAQFTF